MPKGVYPRSAFQRELAKILPWKRKRPYAHQSVCKRGHDFSVTMKRHPNGDTYCSVCKLIRTRELAKKHPERQKKYQRTNNLKQMYGLTVAQYDEFLASQNGGCAICGDTSSSNGRRLHVDHDHATDKIRGILCHSCNTALGLFKENNAILEKAIEYLKKK